MGLLSFQKHYYASFANSSLEFGKQISNILQNEIDIKTVCDFGSGTCEFVYGFTDQKKNFVAIDNHNEKIKDKFLNNKNIFHKLDITKKIDLNKKFDCCVCLEVLEHIENRKTDIVIDNLIRHSDFILFSSAQIGQGGLNHINEQHLDYWINKFLYKNYYCFDYIRPRIIKKKIPYYFKSNTLIFINNKNKNLVSKFKSSYIVKNNKNDNIIYKVRKFMLGLLNYKIVNYLVLINYLCKNFYNKLLFSR